PQRGRGGRRGEAGTREGPGARASARRRARTDRSGRQRTGGVARGPRPYLRALVTTKPVGEGTGLGLAVCRGLVESAGGEIGLDASREGEGGARFYVVLPAPV